MSRISSAIENFSKRFDAKAELVNKRYAISTDTLNKVDQAVSLVSAGVSLGCAPIPTLFGGIWMGVLLTVIQGLESPRVIAHMTEGEERKRNLAKIDKDPAAAEKFAEYMEQLEPTEEAVKEAIDSTRYTLSSITFTRGLLVALVAMTAMKHSFQFLGPFVLGSLGTATAVRLLSESPSKNANIG